jgi:hypothetical protein
MTQLPANPHQVGALPNSRTHRPDGIDCFDLRPLKDDSRTPPGTPDNSAVFLRAAVQQYKPGWQPGLGINLKAGSASGVIDDTAVDNGIPRTDDDLGGAEGWTNANEPSLLYDRLFHDPKPAGQFSVLI